MVHYYLKVFTVRVCIFLTHRFSRLKCNDIFSISVDDCSWISAIEAIWLCILIGNGLAVIFVFAGSIIGCMGTCCAKAPVSWHTFSLCHSAGFIQYLFVFPPEILWKKRSLYHSTSFIQYLLFFPPEILWAICIYY